MSIARKPKQIQTLVINYLSISHHSPRGVRSLRWTVSSHTGYTQCVQKDIRLRALLPWQLMYLFSGSVSSSGSLSES